MEEVFASSVAFTFPEWLFWCWMFMLLGYVIAKATQRIDRVITREVSAVFEETDYETNDFAAFERNTDDLAKAYRDLVAGRFEDAKFYLERSLSDMDSSWRTRA